MRGRGGQRISPEDAPRFMLGWAVIPGAAGVLFGIVERSLAIAAVGLGGTLVYLGLIAMYKRALARHGPDNWRFRSDLFAQKVRHALKRKRDRTRSE